MAFSGTLDILKLFIEACLLPLDRRTQPSFNFKSLLCLPPDRSLAGPVNTLVVVFSSSKFLSRALQPIRTTLRISFRPPSQSHPMRLSFQSCLVAATGFFVGQSLASPILVTPGDAEDIIITSADTVNSTASADSGALAGIHVLTQTTTGVLPLAFTNNLDSSNVHAYVTGLDSNGLLVMLQPSGSWYYPTATSSGVPQEITENVAIPLGAQGSTTKISLPGYISSARIWFADGELTFYTVESASGTASLVEPSAVNPSDPNAGVNWGFIELNWAEDQIYTNVSYVDFVGLPLGMTLTDSTGANQTVEGVSADAVDELCCYLEYQAGVDGGPWDQLCATDSSGNALRVLAPFDYMSVESTAFSNYWTTYVNQVWTHYATNTLTIDTQAAAGEVSCTTASGNLVCDGDNRSYAKPVAADIFGCNSGPFAIQGSDNLVHVAVVPRLCAAFNRADLLLSGGNVQPSLGSSSFYTQSPANWYSAYVHAFETDGKGYAFSYDDVTSTGAPNESGEISAVSPSQLTIVIGGPS